MDGNIIFNNRIDRNLEIGMCGKEDTKLVIGTRWPNVPMKQREYYVILLSV